MSPFHACHSTPLFFITSCPKIPNVSHLLAPNSHSIFLSQLISISLTNALIKCGVVFELYMFVPKNIVTIFVLVFNYFVFGSFFYSAWIQMSDHYIAMPTSAGECEDY